MLFSVDLQLLVCQENHRIYLTWGCYCCYNLTKMKIKFVKSVLLVPLFLLIVTPALAIGKPQDVGTHPNITAQANQQNGVTRACQTRENAIKTRSTHLVNLVTTMESKFDAIATRVEDYYANKVAPSGKTVSNYNTLVSDIQTKKTAIQTALTTAQNDATSFTCTSTNPKGQLTQFRDDMQAVKSVLKDYRTSIKNLIVAVHSVTGTENSESPKPTK